MPHDIARFRGLGVALGLLIASALHAQDSGQGGWRPPTDRTVLLEPHAIPPGAPKLAPPRAIATRTAYELTEAEYDAFMTQCAADGYRPVSLVARTTLDGPRFTIVAHADGINDWLQARSMAATDLAAWAAARQAEGYQPICVAAHGSAPNDLYSLVVARTGDPRNWTLHLALTLSQYNALVNTAAAQNRRATWLGACGSGSAARLAAIVTDNPTSMGWWTNWGMTQANFEATITALRASGGRLASIAPYGTASAPRFATLAHYRRTESWELVSNLSLADMQQREADFLSMGYGPLTIAVSETPDGIRCTGEFVRQTSSRTLTITGDDVPELADFDQAMTEHIQRCDIPNAALAVVKDGRLVAARAYTYAPDGWPIAQPDSLFRIASMSKPLCSTAMHQLAERGALDLDDLIISYPNLDGWNDSRAQDITLRYLLQHRGGWNRNTTFDPVFLYDVPIADALQIPLPIGIWDIITFMKGRNLQFTPGTQQVYSNLGFIIDARVIEAADGRPYEQVIRQDVLAPIGLYRPRISEWTGDRPVEVSYLDGLHARPTSVMSDDQPVLDGYCYGGYNHDNGEAAGAWIFSAPDYARFLSSFDDLDHAPLLPRARIEEMWAPGLGNWPDGVFYLASGWLAARFGGGASWAAGHDGSLFGAATIGLKMQNNVTFVVFMNMRDPGELYEPYQIINPMIALALTHNTWPDGDQFPAYCAADFNRDRTTDTRDVIAFLNAFVAGDDRCDFSGDAAIDTRDVLAYLNVYTNGCN